MHLPPGINRYFIAIVPPSPIEEEALVLKNFFKEKYNSRASLNSPPHITLHMPFQWKTKKENELVDSLEKFAGANKSFPVELSGFGAFPPQVIFIEVEDNPELSQLQNRLYQFCKINLNLFGAQYKDLPFHPHLTIAFRDLKKDKFVLAWNEFKDKPFSASFTLNRITLLKHDGKYWQPIQHFHF